MSTEDHRLLMEALVFFSSSDDSDDANCSGSHHPTGDPSAITMLTNGRMNSHVRQERLSASSAKTQTTQGTRRKRATATQPVRRKRVKKCTYAARREEVARLRASTYQLEAQLEHLRKRIGSSDLNRQRARYEQELLAQSQAENQRLRALLSAGESRIQQARGQNHGSGYAEPQCVV